MSATRWIVARWLLTFVGLALALVVLAITLRALDVHALRAALAGLSWPTLAAAAMTSLASYAAYCGFDVLGRRYSGHRLSTWRVLVAGFIGHAFALNAGAAGVGLRFRSYACMGVRVGQVARLWLVCLVGNWLGLLLLAGTLLASGSLDMLAGTHLDERLARVSGVAMLAVALAYLLACALAPRRELRWRGRALALPSLCFAALQALLSLAHWLLIAATLQILLRGGVPFAAVLGALLLSALALAVVDVPAGLGVTEAVFIATLGARVPLATLLAALLAWRLLYHLLPLLGASLLYGGLEWHTARRVPRTAESPAPHRADGCDSAPRTPARSPMLDCQTPMRAPLGRAAPSNPGVHPP